MEGQRSQTFFCSYQFCEQDKCIFSLLQSLQWFHHFQYNSASSRHHQSRDCSVVQVENTLSIDLAHKLPYLVNFVREEGKENYLLFHRQSI